VGPDRLAPGVEGPPGAVDRDEVPVVHLVDDDVELCASLARSLESVGMSCRCWQDPVSFLAEADTTGWGCVVLDARMPGLDGFTVQERLNQAGSLLPVIFVSAGGDVRMSVRAIRAGAVEFLEKPYDAERLIDSLQQTLRTAKPRLQEARVRRELRRRLTLLTDREAEVLDLVVEGLPSKHVASRLGISVKTVDVHRTRIREKTGAASIPVLMRDILLCGLHRSAPAGRGAGFPPAASVKESPTATGVSPRRSAQEFRLPDRHRAP
jgi:two-component system response regulator FixJ